MVQLLIGLFLFGFALSLAVTAALGTNPWTVFAEGLSEQIGISIGSAVLLTSISLLAGLWLFREPLGVGSVLNVLLIGPIVDLCLWVLPDPESLWVRVPMIIAAPIVLGLASGLYLGAGLGPGTRDGLMTALSRRGIQTWQARTAIELTALAVGFLLGGTVGLGTVWMAASIGPWVQVFLPRLTIGETER